MAAECWKSDQSTGVARQVGSAHHYDRICCTRFDSDYSVAFTTSLAKYVQQRATDVRIINNTRYFMLFVVR